MNFDKVEKLDISPEQVVSTPPNTLLENLTISFDVSKYNGGSGSNSKAFTMLDVWGPIVDELNETGADFENPAVFLVGGLLSPGSSMNYEKNVNEIYSYINENKNNLSPFLNGVTPEFINQSAQDIVNSKNDELAELARTNPGALNTVARFVGAVGAGGGDPVTANTLPLGGYHKGLWKNIAQSTLINAGAGAISEVEVAKWYKELDLEYTFEDFVKNVSLNAAIGGALPLAGAGIRLTARQAEKAFNVLSSKIRRPLSSEDEALIDALNNQADIENSNPLTAPDENQALLEHQNRLETAERAIVNNVLPKMSVEPNSNISTSQLSDNLDGVLFKFNPNEISVDAKTFQFKEGGDEFGVSERLQGITTWDKYKAGVVTVYEYADGSLTIADGHQRLGLAKRILSQDPSQDVKVIGYKLREVDGITPEEARVIAAMKNIAEGTGTSIDAAKVLRVDPSRLSELPPRSELVRQARDMMALSDAAFGAVVNNVIPAKYGAIVGRLIDDQELQTAAIEVLAKADPSNAFQAEAIVRQVKGAGSEQVKQISLFGEEIVTESFYVERAKVLDRAFKELRRDKAAFETLVRNSERLEAEGNILAKTANERKASTDAQTIALLQTLANRKGPLSDALNDAARTARETNSYVAPTSGFIDAIRGSIKSGDFDRLSSGDVGRSVDGPTEITRSEIKEPSLDGFEEATGIAAERQADQLAVDMFGTDEVAAPAAVRLSDDIEADLKARQPVETVNDIYALADESQSYIARIAADIESDLGVTFENPGLKKIVDANDKMQRKGYVSANQMTDISRGGFVINKAEDADAIAAKFGRDAEILDEGWNFTPAGYFDRKLLVRTPNGIVSEIQIWSPKVLEAKRKTGHKLYKKARKSKDPAEIETIAFQMRELYAKALRSEDQSFRSLSGIDNLPKVVSNADINAASSGITRPVSNTSSPSTDVQAPPGSRIATASDGEVEIAGRPSQLTNIIEDTSDSNLDITSADVKSGALFDDMDLEVPSGERINPDTGEIETTTITLRDLKKQLDQEDAMIKRLEFCTV